VVRILSPVFRILFLTNRRKREVEEILSERLHIMDLFFLDRDHMDEVEDFFYGLSWIPPG
jgi:hypothetical protein